MPLPVEQRIRFFVFVIESPSAVDLYHRRSEGEIIRQAVLLNGINCVVKTAISLEAFTACLKIGLAEEMSLRTDFIPLLHISAHGSSDGIQLSDGYVMPWHELREHLRPVNDALGGSLVVCMSSCEGYSGIQMAMTNDKSPLPFFALIGCSEKPTWGETAVAYATLYHQLWRGEYVSDAVNAMCIASGNHMFFLQHAENSRQGYIDYLSTINVVEAQVTLEEQVESEPPENKERLKLLR